MLALLTDNDFRESVASGLLAREPAVDLLRIREVGLRQAHDRDVLQWAADQRRVLVTHDVNTMVGFAYERVARSLPMPGVIAGQSAKRSTTCFSRSNCYEPPEMESKVLFLPL